MRKAIVLMMIVMILLPSALIADPIRTYEPYQENEFPCGPISYIEPNASSSDQ